MPVNKEINREILEEDDAPEEIEHDLIKGKNISFEAYFKSCCHLLL